MQLTVEVSRGGRGRTPSKTSREKEENYFATREEGEDFRELDVRFTLATHLSEIRRIRASISGPINSAKKIEEDEEEGIRRTEGGERKRLVVTRRNEICRSSVPSDDDPMSASHPRQFLQEDHFLEERDDTESCKNRRLRRRTENLSSRGVSQAIICRMSNSAEKESRVIFYLLLEIGHRTIREEGRGGEDASTLTSR
ncbi:hypothetical protein DBV15_09295 [Temnothorax longispinosus]|uniref:Uncharacterized protein n=1 Tax=Temnothorax longispinosus TaxID=300112 RepID=A0A4S2KRZ9_9HYME|nr:hypothetical protein DBV15_09295 [Temnothorax longispinosus]